MGLRNYIDKIKPHFEAGGRLKAFHSVFEGLECFLYVPDTVTRRGSHIRDAMDMKRVISVVILALVPALLWGMFNVGYQHFNVAQGLSQVGVWDNFWFGFWRVLPMIVVCYAVGLAIEFTFAQIRRHEINEGFLATGILIPMIMPPDMPLWIVAVATAFAVIVGKEMFGGTGMNVFNPALLARAFVFFAYPTTMSGNQVYVSGLSALAKEPGAMSLVDGYSGATPLSYGPDALSVGGGVDWASRPTGDWFLGLMPGVVGEVSTLAILLGAAILLFTGVGSWRIMVAVVAGALATGWMFNLIGANTVMDMPAWYHLLLGGFAFGTVFMATDPVTAAQTGRGKWIYGFLIGFLTVTTRVLNPGYPEGMMLAILFMNALAPLIDYYVVQGNVRRRLRRGGVACISK